MRIFCEPGDRRGNSYSPDFEHISAEVQKLRSPEQFATGYPGAICAPHQSYPSGSKVQSACAASSAASTPESLQNSIANAPEPTPKGHGAPWKGRAQTLPTQEGERMRVELMKVSAQFPHFGRPSVTTARDMLAAAQLSREASGFDGGDVTPHDVLRFLASKLDRRKGKGLRTFGGLLVAVYGDFGASLDDLRAEEEAARIAEEGFQRRQEQR